MMPRRKFPRVRWLERVRWVAPPSLERSLEIQQVEAKLELMFVMSRFLSKS
jgi:hypothetical protein